LRTVKRMEKKDCLCTTGSKAPPHT
jgi:hypothetical protein